MSARCRLPAPVLAFVHRVVYGPGYRRAREGAFRRSGGDCQFCGARPAEEAHHWALRYPADDEVTADDLIALCRPCHWMATLRRLMDRTAEQPLWLVLATPKFPVPRLRRVPRRQAHDCGTPERPSPRLPAPGVPTLNLHTLARRCHLTLVAGCLRCGRFVRLDSVSRLRRGWSGSVDDLRRRLICCGCRSRTQWVVLGGWPPATTATTATTGVSAQRPASPGNPQS